MAVIIGKISIEGGPLQDFLAETQEVTGEPGVPTHPIALPPLGIWGGAPLPWPTPPIYYPPGGQPGVPTHPIVLPPQPGVPTHPIVLPPDQPFPEPPPNNWVWAYDEELGWVLVPPGSGGKPQPVPPG